MQIERAASPDMPHCVVFPALNDSSPDAPPVCIYLGTEQAQVRAQRIFLFSVEKHRNPDREYRVYLMKDLDGFDQSQWRTGFTNYRYAIPAFAGGKGRAIYNDVDQIYLEDPAHLFDLPLTEHGYLSISPEDTSVMLIDCARMLPLWNLDTARQQSKRQLIASAAEKTGLWGALDGGWNTRDEEYSELTARVLHYTALHKQPWQPTPTTYSYHAHPLEDLWFELEREADARHYGPFTAEAPSPWFEGALKTLEQQSIPAFTASEGAIRLAADMSLHDLIWCHPSAQVAANAPLPVDRVNQHSLQSLGDDCADGVAVTGLLEHLPGEDIPWVLERLARYSQRLLYIGLHLSADARAADTALHSIHWWQRQLRTLAQHHPRLVWQLDIRRGSSNRVEVVQSAMTGARTEQPAESAQPVVWLLLSEHAGDNAQLRALGKELNWRVVEKPPLIDFKPARLMLLTRPSLRGVKAKQLGELKGPWPDIVMSTGRRTVNIARWIQRHSGGRTQLIWLGRPRAPLHWFDLIVTTPQYGLPAREHIHHNLLPLNRPPAVADDVLKAWQRRLDHLPRPWYGVLVGGTTSLQKFEAEDAREMLQTAAGLAEQHGGSLLITTSPRTPKAVIDALREELAVPSYLNEWQPQQQDHFHPALLALSDGFIVSDDSASMMAEAIRTHRPVWLYQLKPLPLSRRARRQARIVEWMNQRTRQTSARGTHRQQDWRGRFFDRLHSQGIVRTPRDLKHLGETLRIRGLCQPLQGADQPAFQPPAMPVPDEMQATVEEIRRRAGERHWQE
ncbi:ELM1/GtrOC1 family putative glycosyltransferase [Kushneria phosphatilytica]|uniref:ELM1/GtrOC1 family putative glycosyltransferase n=1 Tax=Kushneria phosphatilytica TaxID=657387 RepID=UPI00143A85C0|nr:ELM1/GtrOC1 family putative glycosyltransferase [Kushneria phosphatilytica]